MTRSQRLMAWMRAHAIIPDTIGTVLVAMFVYGTSASIGYNPGLLCNQPDLAQIIWSLLLIIPMAFRRRFPQSSALAYVALVVLHLIFGPCMLVSDLFSLVMLYSVIVYGDPVNTRRFIVLASCIGAFAMLTISWVMTVGAAFGTSDTTANGVAQVSSYHVVYEGQGLSHDCLDAFVQYLLATFVAITVCLISTVILAFWQRARLLTIRMMQERNLAIAEREDEERGIAALAERARIARDMHDVVAHTLSIIIVQSDGGRYAGTHDPAVARHTMETIRHESERALHDMTRLLGVFGGSPHADYQDIDALVEQARAVAPDTTVSRKISGTPAPEHLDAEASVAAYHVVQEALTNIRKYAGPRVHVSIVETWNSDGLRLRVDDDGRGACASWDGHKPGYGLLGMRERVETVGGTVSSGPRTGGGFTVEAMIPFTVGAGPAAVSDGEHIMSGTVDATAYPSESTSRNTDTTGTDARNEARRSPTPKLPKLPSWREVQKRIGSRPVRQAGDPHNASFNWVERLSRWTQRHYVLVDTSTTLLLIALFGLFPFQWGFNRSATSPAVLLLMLMEMLPLCVRRRFPESSALFVACLSTLQLLLCDDVDLPNIVAVWCALYSAVLYGRSKTWRWTGLAVLFNSILLGCSASISQFGYRTIIDLVAQTPSINTSAMAPNLTTAIIIGVSYALVVAMSCAGVMAMALWTRSNDSNTMVLQAREEALLAEEAKQRVLAANMERDRISASIQSEVAATLNSVIDQAIAGLRMMDDAESHGRQPTPQAIRSAFADIGQQGRTALSHMRELLCVLRETGFSDDTHDAERSRLRLSPVDSLDEQIQRNGLDLE